MIAKLFYWRRSCKFWILFSWSWFLRESHVICNSYFSSSVILLALNLAMALLWVMLVFVKPSLTAVTALLFELTSCSIYLWNFVKNRLSCFSLEKLDCSYKFLWWRGSVRYRIIETFFDGLNLVVVPRVQFPMKLLWLYLVDLFFTLLCLEIDFYKCEEKGTCLYGEWCWV